MIRRRPRAHARLPGTATMRHPLSTGSALHALAARLYRIPRSLAGPGVRETLAILAGHAPIETRELASGTKVLDWEVPREWVLRSARLTAPDGRVVADAAVHNLHVLNFSAGFAAGCRAPSSRPTSTPARPARRHPLPDQLLARGLGLLPAAPRAREPARGRLPGRDRRRSRRRRDELGRGAAARHERRRGPPLDPRLHRRWPTTTSPVWW